MSERVIITDYDPRWPEMFELERGALGRVFDGMDVRIEHIGSTAVPGLSAKAIIDILLGAPALFDIELRIGGLEGMGYAYVPEFEDQLPQRRYFRKTVGGVRTHHLHCVVTGDAFWRRHLLFRDYLRAYPESAREYDALKRRLSKRLSNDMGAYTDAKTAFITGIEVKALRAFGSGGGSV